jgi:ribosomal protein L37AE/L43A
MDAVDGLAALEQVVETIGEQLDDLYQRRDIPQAERVTLHSLEWTLAKLNGDLHTMETEVKDLRLAEAAARREVAELTKKVGELERERDLAASRVGDIPEIPECPCCGDPGHRRGDGWKCETCGTDWGDEKKPAVEPYQWQVGDEIECRGVTRRRVTDRSEGWVFLERVESGLSQPDWERRGWKLHRKASDKPAEPAREPYQWQVGDEVALNGEVYKVSLIRDGQYFVTGGGQGTQRQLESCGYWLHRKASDLGVQQLTPRQVEISDGTGTDGEGQS